MPPEWISRMRRRLARRQQLVRARSRAKNEIHAVLMRRLKGRPPVSDLFGVKGLKWLRGLELPEVLDETVKACLRHIEFLDSEIDQVERLICQEALKSGQIRRLLTVPGVNVICAAVFLAAVGDVKRFKGSRPVVAYLGLDPRVYQSGSGPGPGGRISKQGSPQARWALVEAAQSVVQQPGPLHAFYERLRARKGHNSAIVAVARKLAVLFYCMLTGEEDYAHQPTLADRPEAPTTRSPRRRSYPQGHQHRRVGHPRADAPSRETTRRAGRSVLQTLTRRLESHIPQEGKGGCERDTGARIIKALKGHVARQAHEPQTPALRHVIGSRPPHNLTPPADVDTSTDNNPCPNPGHDHAHRPHTSRPTATPATYLARKQTQIPSNSRRASVDFHRLSGASASSPIVGTDAQPVNVTVAAGLLNRCIESYPAAITRQPAVNRPMNRRHTTRTHVQTPPTDVDAMPRA